MADQGKSNGERISQVLIVLITAVIGPIAVWYVTNPTSPMNNRAADPTVLPTAIVAAAEATAAPTLLPTETAAAGVPSATLTIPVEATASLAAPVAATATLTLAPPPTPTAAPTTIQPGSLLPGGTPVVLDGLQLLVSASDVILEGNLVGLQIHLTNQLTKPQTIVYKPGTIKIKDNTGKAYQVVYGDGKDACKKPDLEKQKQVQIEAGKEVVLVPPDAKKASEWCAEDKATLLPYFGGPLPKEAKTLTITFEALGPFKAISFEIEL